MEIMEENACKGNSFLHVRTFSYKNREFENAKKNDSAFDKTLFWCIVQDNPLSLSILLRGRAEVAHQAHNLEVVGSIPAPATN